MLALAILSRCVFLKPTSAFFIAAENAGISRNDQSDMIVKEMMKKHGICIEFVQADYDVSTSAGELHMDVDGMFAKHHSRVTSEKVRATFRKLRADKRYPHSSPIGYLDKGSHDKPLDLERAPILRRVFELYATGEWSLRELEAWAKAQGLTTKPRRRIRKKGEILNGVETEKRSVPVGHNSLQKILTNQFYVGKMFHKGEWTEGMHVPLIDMAMFQKVQQRLKENNLSVKYTDKPFFSYRGLFKCHCGRVYTPYRKKGHVYYNCRCKSGCLNRHKNVEEGFLVKGIQSVLDKVHFADEELADIQERTATGLEQAASKRDAAVEDLHNRKKRVLKDLDYLKQNKITLLREAAMSPAEFTSESQRLLVELEEIADLSKDQTETEREMLAYVLNFSELLKSASALYMYATDIEKRQLAHMIFSELTFVDGKVTTHTPKKEFELLLNRPRVVNGGADGTRTRDLPRDRRTL